MRKSVIMVPSKWETCSTATHGFLWLFIAKGWVHRKNARHIKLEITTKKLVS